MPGFGMILVIVGVALILISAFWTPKRVSFWNLGWALVLAGLLLFSSTTVTT
jgi:membrane-bound ClpP family serine protease